MHTDLDPTGKKIVEAFREAQSDLRTAWGIARDAGLTEGVVIDYAQSHPSVCVASSITPGGQKLYYISPDLKDW